MMTEKQKAMVQEFQCPGCMLGSDITCGKFKPSTDYGALCESQAPGTFILGVFSWILLGMPVGFNKVQMIMAPMTDKRLPPVRLWEKGTHPTWNHLNVPVWALEKDGWLFVRTVEPRKGRIYVDVIEEGTRALTPNAINVAEFVNDID